MFHELEEGDFRGVASEDEIDFGIFDELFIEAGGRIASEDDLGVGMILLYDLGDLDGTVAVDHPMKVDAEYGGLQFGNEFFYIEPGITDHTPGNIDDPRFETAFVEILGDTGETYGIHLEDRGG